MKRIVLRIGLAVLLAAGCGSDDGSVPPGAGPDGGMSTNDPDGGGGGGGNGCDHYTPGADGSHEIVVSHGYDANGDPASVYEVLHMRSDGGINGKGETFEMGRATDGRIHFTSDGAVGILALEDGSLGVFRFDEDGVTVVHSSYAGDFYASDVVIAGDDRSVLVLDGNWRENGGGIYRLDLACDGTLSGGSLVVASKLPRQWRWLPGQDRAAIIATDFGDSPMAKDVHVVDTSDLAAPSAVGSADAFDDDDAINTSLAVTTDGAYALVGDTNAITPGAGNRIGVVALADPMVAVQEVDVEDPYDLLVSPYGNAIAIVSGFGNAIYQMSYDDGAATEPMGTPTELTYEGAKPALPASGVVLTEGPLRGLAVVAENVGVRSIRFEPGGSITDLGAFDLGDGTDHIVGAIGITP